MIDPVVNQGVGEVTGILPAHSRAIYGVPVLHSVGLAADFASKNPDIVETELFARMQRDVAIALSLNQPLLMEGGTGIGKTRAVEVTAAKLGLSYSSCTCRNAEPEFLLGTRTFGKDGGIEFVDGPLTDALRNGTVLVLEEYNVLPASTRVRLHALFDALAKGDDTFELTENTSGGTRCETVKIHPNFRLVATQNPPSDKFPDREVLDPAQLSRFVYIKYPDQLTEDEQLAHALGCAKKLPSFPVLTANNPPLTIQQLRALPGFSILMTQFSAVYTSLRAQVDSGEIGRDQPQSLSFEFKRDYGRVVRFLATYCSDGNLDYAMAQALEYYLVAPFCSSPDMASDPTKIKVRELFNKVTSGVISNPQRIHVPHATSEIESTMGTNFHGAASWAKLGLIVTDIPPIPASITKALLESNCDAFPGKKVHESHMLVLLPKGVSIKKLHELCAAAGVKGLRDFDWAKDKAFFTDEPGASEWVLLAREPLPGIFSMNYESQDAVMALQYRNHDTATARQFYQSLVLHFVDTDERLYTNKWGWLKDETSPGVRASGGDFSSAGVLVSSDKVDHSYDPLGRAACRKF